MDRFLRRVVAQRELEQEVAVLLASPKESVRCRSCGSRTKDNGRLECDRCFRRRTGR